MKNIRICIILLLVFNTLIGCSSEDAVDTTPTDINVASTLSNQRIMGITQDLQGYIWLGTYRGLNRYNGHEMHQYFCDDKPTSLPDNQIRALYTDRKGRMWVSTKNGIAYYTDNDNFQQVEIRSVTNNYVTKFVENSRGELFGIMLNCIIKYDPDQNVFDVVIKSIDADGYPNYNCYIDSEDMLWVVRFNKIKCYSTTSFQCRDVIEIEDFSIEASCMMDNDLWLASKGNVHIYNTLSREWKPTPTAFRNSNSFRNVNVDCICPFTNNGILIGSISGLFVYDPSVERLIHQSDANFPFDAPSFNVTSTFRDKDSNLWLCSETQGYEVRTHGRRVFNANSYLRNAFKSKPVSSVALDRDNQLWIATQSDGFYRFDTKSNELQRYDLAQLAPQFHNEVFKYFSLFADSRGDIWISCSPIGLVQLHVEGKQIKYVKSHNVGMVIVMSEDKEGTIWAGCYNDTFFSKEKNDSHFQTHRIFSNTFTFMSCMDLLHDGRFATLIKGQGLRFIDPTTHELMPATIPDSVISKCVERSIFLPSTLLEDHTGNLWIGTVSNGLLHYDVRRGILRTIEGTPCNDICGLEEDRQGNIWVSTQFGLAKYNTTTQSCINYYSSDGIGGNEFYDRVSCQLPDGTLIFGGAHGLTVFNPTLLTDETGVSLYLEDLRIHNQVVRPETSTFIEKRLSNCDKIQLGYKENSFSISFAALDYTGDDRFSYQYKLEGFNQKWVDAHSLREAFYANLKPNNYTFKVRITTKDHAQVLAEKSIDVILPPAPWATWWAELIYTLLFVSLIVFISNLYVRLNLEKWNRQQSEREKDHEKHINRMNMSFFANVSHEFRTPLTIISGPVNQLVNDNTVSQEHHALLCIVQRSVNRMLRLVNQMMDFHKLEDDALRLEVKHQDIIQLLKQTVELFTLQANEKNLTVKTIGLEDNYLMWIDQDKIEKIIYNLIGNAVKYTPAGGHVDITFDVISRDQAAQEYSLTDNSANTQYIKVSVADSGNGIPDDKLDKIFERYYQLDRQQQGQFNWGTGIGLYFAKKIATLHHGYIKAENRKDGKGAIFSFIIPASEKAYSADEKSSSTPTQTSLYPLASEIIENATNGNKANDDRQTILVVDDDIEIVHYVKTLLSSKYNIIGRFDADTAMEVVNEKAPDLILCDVMMPGKTGYEFCHEVKNDIQICHTPVILVTAKTTTSDQVKGLDSGADAYVTKPFDPTYLQALIGSILQNREKVRHLLAEATQTETLEENVLSPQDNAFMTELYKIMEQELANPDIDVTHMTDLLHISRTKLYYKVKGLTGENPSIFFKRYKLNRAAEFIKEGKYNFSEIADLTGFSSLSHFSTSFKKQFGVTPSEFK